MCEAGVALKVAAACNSDSAESALRPASRCVGAVALNAAAVCSSDSAESPMDLESPMDPESLFACGTAMPVVATRHASWDIGASLGARVSPLDLESPAHPKSPG